MMTQTKGDVAALMAAAATTLLLCRATGLRQERSQVRGHDRRTGTSQRGSGLRRRPERLMVSDCLRAGPHPRRVINSM